MILWKEKRQLFLPWKVINLLLQWSIQVIDIQLGKFHYQLVALLMYIVFHRLIMMHMLKNMLLKKRVNKLLKRQSVLFKVSKKKSVEASFTAT